MMWSISKLDGFRRALVGATLFRDNGLTKYQREALPRAVADLFGFNRLPPAGAEVIGAVVDSLVERGILTLSGPYVYVA